MEYIVFGALSLIVAASLGILLFRIVWFFLVAIGNWRIFEKAGEAGWKSLIPFYSTYVSYGISWRKGFGLIYIILDIIINSNDTARSNKIVSAIFGLLGLIMLALAVINKYYLAKSFNKGLIFTLGLIFFEPLFTIILGFSSDPYVGNQS